MAPTSSLRHSQSLTLPFFKSLFITQTPQYSAKSRGCKWNFLVVYHDACQQETENISRLVVLGKQSTEGRERELGEKEEMIRDMILYERRVVLSVFWEFQRFVWLRGTGSCPRRVPRFGWHQMPNSYLPGLQPNPHSNSLKSFNLHKGFETQK